MHKSVTPVFMMLLITAAALLALYAMGAFDGAGVSYVGDMEHYSGEFSFSGGMKDGLFSGTGIIKLTDGGAFTVGFDEGRFSGDGVIYGSGNDNTNDWRFYGAFHNGRANSGTFYFADGSKVAFSRDPSTINLVGSDWRYNGAINELGQNGTGTFTFEDGSVYTGSFLNGLANGEGEYLNPKGKTIYSGEFVDGYFNGQGAYFSHEGWTYEGHFIDGLFDGEGIVSDGDLIVSGLWKAGVQIERYD